MFEKVDVVLGTETINASCGHYPLKAYIVKILAASQEEKRTKYFPEGFTMENGGTFDSALNPGVLYRMNYFFMGKKIKTYVSLKLNASISDPHAPNYNIPEKYYYRKEACEVIGRLNFDWETQKQAVPPGNSTSNLPFLYKNGC